VQSFDLTYLAVFAITFCYFTMVIVLSRVFGGVLSFIVSTIKISIPIIYFFFLFDGAFIAFDDLNYIAKANLILAQHPEDIFTLGLTPNGIVEIMSMVGSTHYFYYWLQACIQYFFGDAYYIPVFFNVLFSAISTYFLSKILYLTHLKRSMVIGISLFYALHITVISWTSFMGLRDPFILMLSLILYYLLMSNQLIFQWKKLMLIFITIFILVFTRFYVPMVILMSFYVFVFFDSKMSFGKRVLFIFFTSGIILLFFSQFGGATRFINFGVSTFIGSIRFFLTPTPMTISPSYAFVTLDAIVHWILLPFTVSGLVLLFFKKPKTRPFILHLIILLLLYGSLPDQQGVRHRFQISFIIIISQYYGLWWFICFLKNIHIKRKLNEIIE
jgi:hypothetical protein